MKDTPNRDYTRLTVIAAICGLVPYEDRLGRTQAGFYTMNGLNAPVDLSACAEDEKSVLKTALRQLSEKVDEEYHRSIEKDLTN